MRPPAARFCHWHEGVDEADDAAGVGEGRVPLGKGAVGGEQDGLVAAVAAADDLEEQVGVVGAVGEVAELVELCGAPHNSTKESSINNIDYPSAGSKPLALASQL